MNITNLLKVILRYKISMKILEMMLCDIISINLIKNSQIIFEYIRKLCGIKDIRLVSILLQGTQEKYLEVYNKIGTKIQVNCLLRQYSFYYTILSQCREIRSVYFSRLSGMQRFNQGIWFYRTKDIPAENSLAVLT